MISVPIFEEVEMEMMTYLSKLERLSCITFDDVNLKNFGQYHMKLDQVIGNLQFDTFGAFCEASGSF